MKLESVEMEIIHRNYMIVPVEKIVAVEQPTDFQLGCQKWKPIFSYHF